MTPTHEHTNDSGRHRVIVLEIPDWPVHAYLRTSFHDAAKVAARDPGIAVVHRQLDHTSPIAIMHANRVIACSSAARAEGVAVGARRRDAQGACPSLHLAAADSGRDERSFLPLLARIDDLTPGVHLLRPGAVAIRARGPARFYGTEQAAAEQLLQLLSSLEVSGARIAVADGIFTAEKAAHTTSPEQPVRIVPAGASRSFLSPLPVSWLGDDDLSDLLVKLGVTTLGAFADLDIEQVRSRLNERGAHLHRLAGGSDSRIVTPQTPPPELAQEVSFDSPLDLAEQVAFATRTTADRVFEALADDSLICTEVRITLTDDRNVRNERVWLHPTQFDAASLVDRVRWQLQTITEDSDDVTAGVVHVRLEPVAVDHSYNHQPTLLGQGPDQRLHHAMSRVQAMLGHRGVVVPTMSGGRWLSEREKRIPWGDREPASHSRDLPWPGSLPDPLPSEVFRHPRAASVTDADGGPVTVNVRGEVSAAPAHLDSLPVTAWTGPWPIHERQWDATKVRRAHRFQIVDDDQRAWLAVYEDSGWWLEGRYD